MNNAHILITGAAGFIGSHLVEALVAQGHALRVLLRHQPQKGMGNLELLAPDVLDDIEILYGDLRDTEAVHACMQNIDAVFHLGGAISVPYSYRYPEDTLNINVLGTLHVLTAARDLNVSRVILTSSSAVYGLPQYTPIDEQHPLQPQSPYAASKAGAEGLAMSFYHSYDLPVVILRPFNAYGPRQSARAVVPTIISQALTRDTVELGTLEPVRDWLFVTDTVAGLLAAWRADEEALARPINLGTGQSVSVGDLANTIVALIGRKIKVRTSKVRARENDEAPVMVADNRLAEALLGWSPTVSLEEGLRQTIEWVRINLDRFQPKQYTI